MVVSHLVDFSLQGLILEHWADLVVSATGRFRSIPLWQVKAPKSMAHMVWITVGKASKKALSLRVACADDRRVLIPHMLKCRKRYMASLIQDDLLGLDTSCKYLW